jgi:xylan 1,4-beta-xylosidase
MAGESASAGIWAPCLSYSDDLFWLVFTDMRIFGLNPWKDQPNYVVTAPSIEGPWSDPIFLNASGFDPSLFHDEDGKKWLVNMETDHRKPREPRGLQFSGILLQEYDHTQKKLVGETKKIHTGTACSLCEGPHIYKRNGWYYLFMAEGGTGIGHAESVARCRSIDGNYELHPSNPLITSYGHPELRLQRAGHASICDTPDGKRTYMAFLCGRFLPGSEINILGRETSIVELEWQDGWPYVKPEPGVNRINEGFIWNFPTDSFEPPISVPQQKNDTKTYLFKDGIHEDFKNLRIERDPAFYSITSRPGWLRLKGGESPASRYRQTLLAVRQQHFSFKAETKMEFNPKAFQEIAGFCWRYDETRHFLLMVSWNEEKNTRVLNVMSMVSGQYALSHETLLPPTGPLWLGITVKEKTGMFRFSLDGKIWNEVRPILESSTLNSGGFTGPFVGIFCCDLNRYEAFADFEYLIYSGE